jgi:hypothetical protein
MNFWNAWETESKVETALTRAVRGCIPPLKRPRGIKMAKVDIRMDLDGVPPEAERKWRAAARSPNTTVEVLTKMFEDNEYPWVLWIIADSPNITSKMLLKMSSSKQYNVLCSVAKNVKTPPEALKKLANSKDYIVRRAVAKNSSAPPDVLMRLAKDRHPDVRYCVAKNRSTPRKALVVLVADTDSRICEAAVENPSCPYAAKLWFEGGYAGMSSRDFVKAVEG